MLNKKIAFQKQHGLVLCVAAAGGKMVHCHVMEADVK